MLGLVSVASSKHLVVGYFVVRSRTSSGSPRFPQFWILIRLQCGSWTPEVDPLFWMRPGGEAGVLKNAGVVNPLYRPYKTIAYV